MVHSTNSSCCSPQGHLSMREASHWVASWAPQAGDSAAAASSRRRHPVSLYAQELNKTILQLVMLHLWGTSLKWREGLVMLRGIGFRPRWRGLRDQRTDWKQAIWLWCSPAFCFQVAILRMDIGLLWYFHAWEEFLLILPVFISKLLLDFNSVI